jgi:hypothetical protein
MMLALQPGATLPPRRSKESLALGLIGSFIPIVWLLSAILPAKRASSHQT